MISVGGRYAGGLIQSQPVLARKKCMLVTSASSLFRRIWLSIVRRHTLVVIVNMTGKVKGERKSADGGGGGPDVWMDDSA